MVPRKKLRDTKMTKTENASSCLTRVSHVRDELGVAREKVDDVESFLEWFLSTLT